MNLALLFRARLNAGDYIINRRTAELLKKYTPMKKCKAYKGWKKIHNVAHLNKHFDGICICGGPALYPYFHSPKIYPLVDDIRQIKIPIYVIGVGLGVYFNKINGYAFTRKSLNTLKYISKYAPISVRDEYAYTVLKRNNIPVVFTGCPVLHYMDEKPTYRKTVKKIAFTPLTNIQNVNRNILIKQNNMLIHEIMRTFPDAKVTVVEHRGAETKVKGGHAHINISGNSLKIKVYKDYDMHIGFRLHGHLYFLSMHKPSYLITFDIRMKGMSASMKTDKSDRYYKHIMKGNDMKVWLSNIVSQSKNGFLQFNDVYKNIEERKKVMIEFLKENIK